jgi:hypothetical protein
MLADSDSFGMFLTQGDLDELDPLYLISCELPPRISCVDNSELHRDLDVDGSIWDAIEKSSAHRLTRGGRTCLRASLLSDPLTRRCDLDMRQSALRALEGRWDARGDADGIAQAELAALEGDVLWLLKIKSDEALSSVYDAVLFNSWLVGPMINKRSPMALLGLNVYRICVSPALGALTPLIYFVVPYIILYRKTRISFSTFLKRLVASAVRAPTTSDQSPFGVQLPSGVAMGVRSVSLLLSVMLYFHGVVSSVSTARMMYRIVSEIRHRMTRVRRFIDVATARQAALWREEDAFDVHFGPVVSGAPGEHTPPTDNGCCIPLYASPTCGIATRSAECLHSYASVDIPRLATCLLRRVYALDAAVGVLAAKRDLGMCWVVWDDAPGQQTPRVRMIGLVHPALIGSAGAVRNDVEIGSDLSARSHVVLTGPNAGGKSTLMKSVLTAALLAQTLTIAPCSSCTLTPFSRISSHINVADAVGCESMFEAEMRRVLRVLASPPADGSFMLVALDELFSSTNPVEGVAAAVACVRRLASNTRVLSIVSTHYTRICTELERDADTRVAFHQMPVSRVNTAAGYAGATHESLITFPYLLRPGVCRQHIALELMAMQPGFDVPLILDAIRVKRRTAHKTVSAQAVSAQAVSAQAVSAQAVSAQAVSAQAVSAQAVSAQG